MLMKVAADGHIVDAKEGDSHFPDSKVIECCRTAAKGIVLSKPLSAGLLHLALRVGELEPVATDSKTAAQPGDTQ